MTYPNNFAGPRGFPVWVWDCHFFNFLFVMMLIRSGPSILMDHPRLYFNDGCTPGSERIPLTPLKVPRDRIWTAKDDARYISPLIATPGGKFAIPSDQILLASHALKADLIILELRRGAHTETASHMPWDVAYKVVCGARCPVLTIRN